jgi:hypothetical protein
MNMSASPKSVMLPVFKKIDIKYHMEEYGYQNIRGKNETKRYSPAHQPTS